MPYPSLVKPTGNIQEALCDGTAATFADQSRHPGPDNTTQAFLSDFRKSHPSVESPLLFW